MSYGIEWAPVAARDLLEVVEYIASEGRPEAAEHASNRILARVRSLAMHPRRSRIVPELKRVGVTEYRDSIVGPYRIFFRVTQRSVGIVGVLDGRRDLEELLFQRYAGG
ncbi:MAG: type II toxin-antitoxin system RelE/ParE family toxin [Thermoleophilaceae bacterium]|nr:type II toxin-antitoxin system RelE/ParE family toxin [Thermoleophilaceae bacterium]